MTLVTRFMRRSPHAFADINTTTGLLLRSLSIWSTSGPNEWNRAVSDAEKIVGYPTSFMSLRCLLSDELSNVAIQVRKLVGTKHPLLKTARGFLDNGKHSSQTRGLVVLLISKAAGPSRLQQRDHKQDMISGIYPSQRSLAEITEVIHTANLIHKGVVNLQSITNGEIVKKDMELGNKLAVLSGDFLLANASTGLAALNNTKVVEIISSAISDLMKADFTMLRDHNGNPTVTNSAKFSDWIEQTYLSSGSLLAKSCQSAMELANHEEDVQQAAFEFGRNMALARQLSEELTPFLSPEGHLSSIQCTSAPVIMHVESTGDTTIDEVKDNPKELLNMVQSGTAVEECVSLCRDYGLTAMKSLDVFEDSEAKEALYNFVNATCEVLPPNS